MCGTSTTTKTSNDTTATTLPQWATDAGQADYGNTASWLGSHPWQGYSGPTSASFGPETDTASSFLTNTLGTPNANLADAGKAASSVAGAIDPNASISSLMDPYVAATLQPTLENLGIQHQQQTAQLGSQAAMSGAFGDSTQGVQQSLLDKYNNEDVANATGAAYSGAYNAATALKNNQLQQILGAGTLQSGVGQQENQQNDVISQLLGSIGAQKQSAGQTGITNAIQLNTQNQTEPLSQADALARILAMSPMNTTTNQNGTATQSQPDNSGFALLGSLMSAIPFPA